MTLPPIQSDDVERFGAQSETIALTPTKCPHERLVRLNANSVQCACGNGWSFDGPIPQVFLDRI